MFDGKISAVLKDGELTKENIILASVGEKIASTDPNLIK